MCRLLGSVISSSVSFIASSACSARPSRRQTPASAKRLLSLFYIFCSVDYSWTTDVVITDSGAGIPRRVLKLSGSYHPSLPSIATTLGWLWWRRRLLDILHFSVLGNVWRARRTLFWNKQGTRAHSHKHAHALSRGCKWTKNKEQSKRIKRESKDVNW